MAGDSYVISIYTQRRRQLSLSLSLGNSRSGGGKPLRGRRPIYGPTCPHTFPAPIFFYLLLWNREWGEVGNEIGGFNNWSCCFRRARNSCRPCNNLGKVVFDSSNTRIVALAHFFVVATTKKSGEVLLLPCCCCCCLGGVADCFLRGCTIRAKTVRRDDRRRDEKVSTAAEAFWKKKKK